MLPVSCVKIHNNCCFLILEFLEIHQYLLLLQNLFSKEKKILYPRILNMLIHKISIYLLLHIMSISRFNNILTSILYLR